MPEGNPPGIDRLLAAVADLEAIVAGWLPAPGVVVASLGALNADLDHPAGTYGRVTNSGLLYRKSGNSGTGSWVQTTSLLASVDAAVAAAVADVAGLKPRDTRFYSSKADAEARVDALPDDAVLVLQRDGFDVHLRLRTWTDSPLSGTTDPWGIFSTVAKASDIYNLGLRDTRFYTSKADAEAGVNDLPAAVAAVLQRDGFDVHLRLRTWTDSPLTGTTDPWGVFSTIPGGAGQKWTRLTSSATFTKDPRARLVHVWLCGGGHGGGSGATAATGVAVSGGGGGCGGAMVEAVFAGADVPATVAVTIGAGGAGGAAVSAPSSGGADGAGGGNTSFGSLLTTRWGTFGFGRGGSTSGAQGGVAATTRSHPAPIGADMDGGDATLTGGAAGVFGPGRFSGSAGAGGAISAAEGLLPGGAGGKPHQAFANTSEALAVAETAGADGALSPLTLIFAAGGSGAGGSPASGGVGRRGGNGGAPGGGGGGGSAGRNGQASGAGGAGADGAAWILEVW